MNEVRTLGNAYTKDPNAGFAEVSPWWTVVKRSSIEFGDMMSRI